MKRLLPVFLLCAALLLCACGKKATYNDYTGYLTTSSSVSPTPALSSPASAAPAEASAAPVSSAYSEASGAASPSSDFTSSVTVISSAPSAAASSDPYANATTVTVSTPVPTVSPSPAPTAAPTPVPNLVTITKSPTSETVQEGGSAMFIAYAENYTGIVWITVSPDKQTSYEIGDAAGVFTGLGVSGQGTSVLTLSNIPYAMNGWRIQAYFTGNGGPAYTNGAYLTVTSASSSVVIPSSGTSSVTDVAEQACLTLSNQVFDALYNKGISYGYTVSNMENYYYANSSSDFNVTFSNSTYRVVGEFRASYTSAASSGYSPVRVVVYRDSTEWLSMNLSDKTLDYFYNVLYEYRA